MNERIKQLWEESQQWNGSDDGRGGLKILESVEKFADLIVKECVNTLEFHGFEDAIPYVKWMATNKLGQHFGVEE